MLPSLRGTSASGRKQDRPGRKDEEEKSNLRLDTLVLTSEENL